MALRDKLVQRALPHLEPGERVQSVFLAQTGPSPYWILLSAWIVIFSAGYSVVVVTDRAILVLRGGRMVPSRVKGVRYRAPRNQWFGLPTGLWGRVAIAGRGFWVHRRFHKDVLAADAALAAMFPGSPAPAYVRPPQPYGPGPQQPLGPAPQHPYGPGPQPGPWR